MCIIIVSELFYVGFRIMKRTASTFCCSFREVALVLIFNSKCGEFLYALFNSLQKYTHSVLWLTSEQKQAHVSPGLKDPYCNRCCDSETQGFAEVGGVVCVSFLQRQDKE